MAEPECGGYMREGCEMMRRVEGGDILIKNWAFIAGVVAIIGTAAVALFRVDLNAGRQETHEVVDMHPGARAEFRVIHDRSARFEERQITIQRDVERLRQEQSDGFERVEKALKNR